MTTYDLTEQKRQAVKKAIQALTPGKSLALGTGSTAELFIHELSRWPHVSTLKLCSTSQSSTKLAEQLGLTVLPLETQVELDYSLDGADFVDPHHQLLKGFGGALTREKIAARLAKELWIMIDDTKKKNTLPLERIPCEVLPCAIELVRRSLGALSLPAHLRLKKNLQDPYITDNGNNILDIDARRWTKDLEALDLFLKTQTGLLEHGLFLNFPVRLFQASS